MLISKINMIWETYTKQKCFKHYFLLKNNGYKDESPLKRGYKRWWRKREKHRNCFEYSCLESSFYVVHACKPWEIIYHGVSHRGSCSVSCGGTNLELHISHFKSSLSEYFNLSNLHVLFLVLVPRNLSKIHKILAPPDTQTETAFEPFHDG